MVVVCPAKVVIIPYPRHSAPRPTLLPARPDGLPASQVTLFELYNEAFRDLLKGFSSNTIHSHLNTTASSAPADPSAASSSSGSTLGGLAAGTKSSRAKAAAAHAQPSGAGKKGSGAAGGAGAAGLGGRRASSHKEEAEEAPPSYNIHTDKHGITSVLGLLQVDVTCWGDAEQVLQYAFQRR